MAARLSASTPMQLRQFGERVGPHRRHLGTDGALIIGDVEQSAVEDRVGNRARRLEMDVAREPLPGFVHEAAAFVEEAAAVLVDHDAVGIDQHDRRGILAARIDRLAVHAVPIARFVGAEPQRHSMPSPVLKRVPGEISRIVSPPSPKCLRIISALPWKPPQASTMASAGKVRRAPVCSTTRPVMRPFSVTISARRSRKGSPRRPAWPLASTP